MYDLDFFNAYVEQNPVIFYSLITTIGLMIGSFLNVVIHRLPLMMEQQWSNEARYVVSLLDKKISLIKPQTTLEPEIKEEKSAQPYNLAFPHSHCPNCKYTIKPWENIPLLSYLIQGGKCNQCKIRISARYPIIELTTALLSLIAAVHFGFTWNNLGALILTWSLIALTMIDFDTQLLPDQIVFPLLWLGLIFNLYEVFVPLEDAIIGAIVGYLSLWSVYWAFKLFTGKEGMGYGDFKLLAALGAWLGYQSILSIILFSSFAGAFIGIALILIKGRDKQIPIAFGPYLALGGWVVLIFPDKLQQLLPF